jgi:hypothetical protein
MNCYVIKLPNSLSHPVMTMSSVYLPGFFWIILSTDLHWLSIHMYFGKKKFTLKSSTQKLELKLSLVDLLPNFVWHPYLPSIIKLGRGGEKSAEILKWNWKLGKWLQVLLDSSSLRSWTKFNHVSVRDSLVVYVVVWSYLTMFSIVLAILKIFCIPVN